MSWLAISGIDLSSIAATAQDPKSERRDIGEQAAANDGSLRVTRQARKYDFSCISVPLQAVDAFAWESLIVGAGHVWSFDASYYGSKGLVIVPSSSGDTSIQGATKKYGAAALKVLVAAEYVTTSPLGFNGSSWTQSVWWNQNGAGWHHVVKRSDGTKWIDGAISGGGDPFGSGVSADVATLTCATGPDYFDDWIVMPGLWPTTWAPLVFALGAAFSPLPYLNCSGDLVPETSVRSMVGAVNVDKIFRANPSGVYGAAAKTVQTLQIDLKGA